MPNTTSPQQSLFLRGGKNIFFKGLNQGVPPSLFFNSVVRQPLFPATANALFPYAFLLANHASLLTAIPGVFHQRRYINSGHTTILPYSVKWHGT